MKYWLNAGFLPIEQLVGLARSAEQLGFEGISLPDHLFFPRDRTSPYPYSSDGELHWPADAPWPDCWGSIAAMAAATTRLRFTTSIYIAPLRDVFSLAKAIATAEGFGPGRVSAGLGAGWLREEFDIVGQDFATRGRRLDEMLDALRLLWSGEMVEFHGDHVSFEPIRMLPRAGSVPVLVGGNTRPALRRAASHDGWIGSYTDLDDAARMLGDLTFQREQLGRSGTPFEVLFAARPGVARSANELAGLGVDGIVIPVLSLTESTAADHVVAGLERFVERWME